MLLLARMTDQFRLGDIYEDVFFHPCLCIGVSEKDDEIWGISLIDGSNPRTCSLNFSAIRRLTVEEAWQVKQSHSTRWLR